MKKILVESWESKDQEDKVIKESILEVLNVIMNVTMNKENLAGFDNMKFINKVIHALSDARETGTLVIDDSDHEKLVGFCKEHVPAQWGTNVNIYTALEKFMNA